MSGTVHWFWSLVVLACLVWYSTVTVYVAVRGTFDIRRMLERLKNGSPDAPSEDPPRPR